MESELWFVKVCSWFTADIVVLGYRDTVITSQTMLFLALNADRPAHQQAGNNQLQAPIALPMG
jgi:hypothetical protein